MSWHQLRKPTLVLGLIATGLWFMILSIALGILFFGDANASAKWGQFGDAFGVVNALFTGIAMLGAIAAILVQREDLDASLKAQKESAEAQKEQTRLAILVAALDGKRTVVAGLEGMLRSGAGNAEVRAKLLELAEVLPQMKKDVLAINGLLDRELRRLVPEYHAESK